MKQFEPLIVDAEVLDSELIIDADALSGDEIIDADAGMEINPKIVVGVKNYADLPDKPSINEHELHSGENSLADLRIGLANNTDINNLFK